jgi:hypothetical protein
MIRRRTPLLATVLGGLVAVSGCSSEVPPPAPKEAETVQKAAPKASSKAIDHSVRGRLDRAAK